MIIIKESIKEHNEIFKSLCTKLKDVNYVVGLRARTFSFVAPNDDSEFTLANLRTIFPEHSDIAGSVEKIGIVACTNYINRECIGWGEVWDPLPEKVIVALAHEFWTSVGKIIELPLNRAYHHDPEEGSLFYEGVMWKFCCIFLNDKTMSGIVLHGDAWD